MSYRINVLKMLNHVKIIHAIKVDIDVKYRADWC